MNIAAVLEPILVRFSQYFGSCVPILALILTSCGAPPEERANTLFVQTVGLLNEYSELSNDVESDPSELFGLISQAQTNASRITQRYPETSIAVQLAQRGAISSYSINWIAAQASRLETCNVETAQRAALLCRIMEIDDDLMRRDTAEEIVAFSRFADGDRLYLHQFLDSLAPDERYESISRLMNLSQQMYGETMEALLPTVVGLLGQAEYTNGVAQTLFGFYTSMGRPGDFENHLDALAVEDAIDLRLWAARRSLSAGNTQLAHSFVEPIRGHLQSPADSIQAASRQARLALIDAATGQSSDVEARYAEALDFAFQNTELQQLVWTSHNLLNGGYELFPEIANRIAIDLIGSVATADSGEVLITYIDHLAETVPSEEVSLAFAEALLVLTDQAFSREHLLRASSDLQFLMPQIEQHLGRDEALRILARLDHRIATAPAYDHQSNATSLALLNIQLGEYETAMTFVDNAELRWRPILQARLAFELAPVRPDLSRRLAEDASYSAHLVESETGREALYRDLARAFALLESYTDALDWAGRSAEVASFLSSDQDNSSDEYAARIENLVVRQTLESVAYAAYTHISSAGEVYSVMRSLRDLERTDLERAILVLILEDMLSEES
jgi:hypothetical protein